MAAVLPLVAASAREFDVPVAMVLAVIRTESNFDPDAVSEAGAMGLMQLLPDTFSYLCEELLRENRKPSDITDPAVNIRYGTYYLSYLKAHFVDWPVVLAAYNAGEGRVTEWLENEKLAPNGHLEHIPFPETESYVSQTLKFFEVYTDKYPS